MFCKLAPAPRSPPVVPRARRRTGRSCYERRSRWIRFAVPAAGGAWPWSRGSPRRPPSTGSSPIVVGGGSSRCSRERRPGRRPRHDVAPRRVPYTRLGARDPGHATPPAGTRPSLERGGGAVRPLRDPKPVEARVSGPGWPSSVPRGVPGDPTPCAGGGSGGGSVNSAGTRTATGPIQMPGLQDSVWVSAAGGAARNRGLEGKKRLFARFRVARERPLAGRILGGRRMAL